MILTLGMVTRRPTPYCNSVIEPMYISNLQPNTNTRQTHLFVNFGNYAASLERVSVFTCYIPFALEYQLHNYIIDCLQFQMTISRVDTKAYREDE